MELRDRLRRARLSAGLTQQEVAERSGIRQPTIAAYESGARIPSEHACRSILTAIGVRPSTLLSMHRDEVVTVLAERGIADPLVFGSVARGDDDEGSDVDLIVTFPKGTTLLDVAALDELLEAVIGVDVDVVSARGLHPERNHLHRRMLADAVPL